MRISVFNILLVIILLSYKTILAIPAIPKIYISGALSQYTNTTSAEKNTSYTTTKQTTLYGTALNLSAGITPINLPIFNMFRIEGEYYNNFNNNIAINSYGVSVFVDLKILPLIYPYIGVGYHSGNVKFNKELPGITTATSNFLQYKKEHDVNFYSFHVGADVTIPVIGLSVFAEYKLMAPTIKLNATDKNMATTVPLKYGLLSHNILLGLKYFIL